MMRTTHCLMCLSFFFYLALRICFVSSPTSPDLAPPPAHMCAAHAQNVANAACSFLVAFVSQLRQESLFAWHAKEVGHSSPCVNDSDEFLKWLDQSGYKVVAFDARVAHGDDFSSVLSSISGKGQVRLAIVTDDSVRDHPAPIVRARR